MEPAARCLSRRLFDRESRAGAYPIAFLPKRVPLKRNGFDWSAEPGRKELRYSGKRAFCADGGISNNLSSQWAEENDPNDWPYRLLAAFNKGRWQPGSDILEVTIDASGPPRAMRTPLLWVHGLGELRSLFRAISLLYENTLAPRRGGVAWELTEIHNAGYAALESRVNVPRRGVHRRTLVPLDPDVPIEASEGKTGRYLLRTPDIAGLTVIETLRATGMPPEAIADVLKQARDIPTTLFRLSRQETISAILGGYLATMINCGRYEKLGMPDALAESISRIETLV